SSPTAPSSAAGPRGTWTAMRSVERETRSWWTWASSIGKTRAARAGSPPPSRSDRARMNGRSVGWMRWGCVLALGPAALPAAALAQDADHLAASEEVYTGWKYFQVYCARCHGDNALGTM